MMTARAAALVAIGLVVLAQPSAAQTGGAERIGYKVLATSRTSTMEREMNETAGLGFRFGGVMGGETAFGGSEAVVVMVRNGPSGQRYEYRLLATNRTTTMQKELQAAGDEGFEYRGQTVFKAAFGGTELVVILERDRQAPIRAYEYRLLATKKTSTMAKELGEAGDGGFDFVGLTVADTAVGGQELVVITRRVRR
jgi:hypothetical protein